MKKYVITGTAPSWALTPWDDPDACIAGLNDAYQLDGFLRADEWFDFHPIDKFHFPPKAPEGAKNVVYAHTIPYGYYVRPAGHLDWLATQPFAKYLHPDFATQMPAAATWPNVHPFPRQDCEDYFGKYFTSSPAWMLARAVMLGYREIHIYGIHLSTESEYIDQRPNFEFLIGCVLGRGKRTVTVKDKLRYYESQDGVIVMPEASPVLSADHQYAFEPSPRRKADPLKWELHKAEMKYHRTMQALLKPPVWLPWRTFEEPIPGDPDGKNRIRRASTGTLQAELTHYTALMEDCRDQLARAGR